MTKNQPDSAWILRISPQESFDLAKSEGIVGIGWSAAKGLDRITDWDKFKTVIRKAYPDLYSSERGVGNAGGSIWRFIHDMNVGDLVVVPQYDGFYIAKVASEIRWSQDHSDHDFSWQRKAEWLTTSAIPRDHASSDLRRRMKARQTCVDASDLIEQVQEARDSEAPLLVAAEIRNEIREAVMEQVDRAVDSRGLEKLVCALVRASGCEAKVQSTRQVKAGDVDVLARVRIPAHEGTTGGRSEITIGYQVKQHEGLTGMDGLDQIWQAVEGGKVDFGFLVSSAPDFDDEVKNRLAEHSRSEGDSAPSADKEADVDIGSRIGLINRSVLANWIIDTGLDRVSHYMD